MGLYLYGAGVVAFGVYKAIEELFGIKIKGFLVTDKRGQPDQIEGVPVYSLGKCEDDLSESRILIATPEEYQGKIEQELLKRGFFNYRKLDSHTKYELMGSYLKKVMRLSLIGDYQTGGRIVGCDAVCVYMAVSHRDKKLEGKYRDKPWIQKIQVGAALTNRRIVELTDEEESGLSAKNALYGELTASYYAWKYNCHRITGLFHYRRILHVTEEQLYLLEMGKVHVILPLPFVCYPDAAGQYGRYLAPQDVEILRQVLKEREGKRYKRMDAILQTPYLYNYNMLIARKEVFDDYCSWMFPLLEEIACRCEKEERERLPRYVGRIGEVLTSLYFMENEKGWIITHGELVWRV